MTFATTLIICLSTVFMNLVLLGMCIKLYTEFIKEKKYRQ